MKKALNFFALFAVLILAVSARTERLFQAKEDHNAPSLVINGTDALSLADFKGDYVLVNFWATTDAESRIAAKGYDALARQSQGERFRHVAVNLDHSERLYREIIRRDGLDSKTHHHADATSAREIAGAWHLDNGLRAYLIDPAGKIIAVNPSHETLSRLTARAH